MAPAKGAAPKKNEPKVIEVNPDERQALVVVIAKRGPDAEASVKSK